MLVLPRGLEGNGLMLNIKFCLEQFKSMATNDGEPSRACAFGFALSFSGEQLAGADGSPEHGVACTYRAEVTSF